MNEKRLNLRESSGSTPTRKSGKYRVEVIEKESPSRE